MFIFPEIPQKSSRLLFEQTQQRKIQKVSEDHAERFGVFAEKAEPDIIWLNKTIPKKRAAFAHAFDKRMMFLSAARSAYFGYGDFEEIGKRSWKPGDGLTGLVEIQKLKWKTDPASLFLANIIGDQRRFYTPYLPLINNHVEGGIKITRGWCWEKPQRLFEKFAVKLGDQIKACRPENLNGNAGLPEYEILSAALKKMYVAFFGWLGRVENKHWSTELYRPDWRGLIVSTAAVNLFRNILNVHAATGKFPFAINHDCIMYFSDEAEPVEFAQSVAADQLRFTHEWSVPAAAFYDAIADEKNATQLDSLGKKIAAGETVKVSVLEYLLAGAN